MDLQTLYPLYFQKLAGYCRRMAWDGMDGAEDLAQEAFLRAMGDESFEALRPEQQRAWLNRTARRLAIDQARRLSRQPALPPPEPQDADWSAVTVGLALGLLDPLERQLVALRYLAGWNSTQIGEEYGLPAATVRTKLRAASKKLRRFYSEERGSSHEQHEQRKDARGIRRAD